MYRTFLVTVLFALAAVAATGCRKPVHFPGESVVEVARALDAVGAYDTDRDSKADFFAYANAAGRIDRIAYDNDGDEPTSRSAWTRSRLTAAGTW